jgi:phosphoribosylglycinamide formyltransferase-1
MSATGPLRLVVLLSGGGRTLLNLDAAIAAGSLDASIVLVISNRARAKGVERARAAGHTVEVIRPQDFDDSEAFHSQLTRTVLAAAPDLVILAGYLARLAVPASLQGRVLNIHPALLPRYGGQGFYGDRVHAAVLEAGDTESGCSVHIVDEHYDHGQVLDREVVAVLTDDTVETLAARVFEAECRLYPRAIAAYGRQRPGLGY